MKFKRVINLELLFIQVNLVPKLSTKIESSLIFDRQMRIKDWDQQKISQEVN